MGKYDTKRRRYFYIGKTQIRPEIDEPKYWLHLILIAAIVLYSYTYIETSTIFPVGWGMLKTVGILTALIGVSDIIVHTILKLD